MRRSGVLLPAQIRLGGEPRALLLTPDIQSGHVVRLSTVSVEPKDNW